MSKTKVTFKVINSRAITGKRKPEPTPTYQFTGKIFYTKKRS